MLEFNALERAVMAAYGEIYGAEEPRLAGQLTAVQPTARENTGSGFHTYLKIDRSVCETIPVRGTLGEHFVHVAGLQHGIGLLLFFSDGYLSEIDGYAQGGEDTTEIDFSNVSFGPLEPILFQRL